VLSESGGMIGLALGRFRPVCWDTSGPTRYRQHSLISFGLAAAVGLVFGSLSSRAPRADPIEALRSILTKAAATKASANTNSDAHIGLCDRRPVRGGL